MMPTTIEDKPADKVLSATSIARLAAWLEQLRAETEEQVDGPSST